MGCESVRYVKSHLRENLLESLLIKLKQDLQRGSKARCLHLSPEPAFVTSDAIHYPGDITEVDLKLFLDNLGSIP